MKKTLIVGAAIVDILMRLDHLPKSGDDILARSSDIGVGGCAFNVASTIDNLGGDFDLFVPVGNGPVANVIREGLIKKGFNPIIEDPSMDNGYCVTFIENNGERTFVTIQGLEGNFKKDWLKKVNLSDYENIYLAGYEVLGEEGHILSDWLSDFKGNIFFAPGPMIRQIDNEVMDKFFKLGAIFHLNATEAMDYTRTTNIDDALVNSYNKSKTGVFVTMGADGCAYYDGTSKLVFPSDKIEVVDTVGAGDSHIASIIYGLSAGNNTESSIELANKVASNVVSHKGAVMSNEEFKRSMEELIDE